MEEDNKQETNQDKKKINFFKKNGKKKVKIIIILILVILAIIAIMIFVFNHKSKAESKFLGDTLKENSDLITAQLDIYGILEYEDKGVKFINRSDFIMYYEGTVYAGIDVSKVDINIDSLQKKAKIEIPQAQILENKTVIHTENCKIYKSDFSIVNFNEREDGIDSITKAKEKCNEKAKSTESMTNIANDQSEKLVKDLIKKSLPKGYVIEVSTKNN